MRFAEKRVVVTGGTRGIGRAITLAFIREGGQVVACYRSRSEDAAALEREVESLPGSLVTLAADVSLPEQAQIMVGQAVKELGGLDILVNNAGFFKDAYLAMLAEDDWRGVVGANLDSVFYVSKWALRALMANRQGCIVNLASVSALIAPPGQASYAAAKAGIVAFTKVAAKEGGRFGVRVNAVAPGLIETEALEQVPAEEKERIVAMTSLARLGTPEEVAKAVLFLASDEASFITGQTLVVDGGLA
jgi:3-oxoacyl-[acyl-carrier protein] reductase